MLLQLSKPILRLLISPKTFVGATYFDEAYCGSILVFLSTMSSEYASRLYSGIWHSLGVLITS